jgi:hypothetical protein
LQDFSRFVDQKLKNGDAESLVELAGEWERQRHNGKPEIYEVEIPIEFDADTLKELAGAFPEEIDERKLDLALSRRDGITTAQLLSKAAAAAEKAARE